MLEVEAALALDSPFGPCRLTGRGQNLVLDLPREATVGSMWRSWRSLAGAASVVGRGLEGDGLRVDLRWRGETIGRLGRGSRQRLAGGRMVPPGFQPLALLRAALSARRRSTSAGG